MQPESFIEFMEKERIRAKADQEYFRNRVEVLEAIVKRLEVRLVKRQDNDPITEATLDFLEKFLYSYQVNAKSADSWLILINEISTGEVEDAPETN